MTALAPVLEGYFTERLLAKRASPATISSYRDTFCLLLGFASARAGAPPSLLDMADLGPEVVVAFLDHLERERSNSVATRNLRLAGVHSLFAYAALRCPEHAALVARVLAIPRKRGDQRLVSFLSRAEAQALLGAPDRSSWAGRRDYSFIALALQAGLRVSELTGLCRGDIELSVGANVHCTGKGRRERRTPLTAGTVRVLRAWLAERPGPSSAPLFPTRAGGRLSTDAVADLLAKYVALATRNCPSLASKRVSPHTLRHTCAMQLLEAGVDPTTIALWLGHASPRSTQPYLHADLAMKERALALIAPLDVGATRYRPPDPLLAFLKAL
jgi:integrase/recombinase XerD